MPSDETIVTCTVTGALAVVGVAALVTGNDGGLVQTIVAALAAFVGVGLGRASKKSE